MRAGDAHDHRARLLACNDLREQDHVGRRRADAMEQKHQRAAVWAGLETITDDSLAQPPGPAGRAEGDVSSASRGSGATHLDVLQWLLRRLRGGLGVAVVASNAGFSRSAVVHESH